MNRKRRDRVRTEARSGDAGLVPAGWLAVVLLALVATSLVAQQGPARLTLEEAIDLAKRNNPTFLSTQNDRSAANWQVREAFSRFLPSVNTSLAGTWMEAGVQRFGTIVFSDQVTDWFYSGYSLNIGLTIDGNSIFGIPNARANKRSTEARLSAAEFTLESTVAFQYMAALRFEDGVDVAQRQLDRARQNLQIVDTRVATGAAAGMEGRQAEVDLGRAEVGLINAQRDLGRAKLLLAEQLGVALDVDVELSSEFDVFEPDFDVEELLRNTLTGHPSLHAFRAQKSASRAAARQTSTSQYLPTLRLSASLRGQAQEALNEAFVLGQAEDRAAARMSSCEFTNALISGLSGGLPGYTIQDCSGFALDDEGRAAVLAANASFPFDFTTMPATVSATLSLPIFTGFTRQRQVAQANALAEDAEHNLRAEQLRLRTAVTSAYDNLVSGYQVVQLEARNQALAEEQLLLQQRRYALGAAALLELLDAQTTTTTADQAYLNALYDFHYSLIALEAAVGQPLRPRTMP